MDISLKENIGEHNNIEVEAYYSLGGANYFRGGSDKRGFYFRVHGNHLTFERGFISRKYLMFGSDDKDFKFLIVELKRDNKKRLAEINAAIDTMDKDKIIALYAAGDKRGLIELMVDAVGVTGLKIAA